MRKVNTINPELEQRLFEESGQGLTVEALDYFLSPIRQGTWHSKERDLYGWPDSRVVSRLNLQLPLTERSLEVLTEKGVIETRDIPLEIGECLRMSKSHCKSAEELGEKWMKFSGKLILWGRGKKLDRISQEWEENRKKGEKEYREYVDKTSELGIPAHVTFGNGRKAVWLTKEGGDAVFDIGFLDIEKSGKIVYGTGEYKKALERSGAMQYIPFFTNLLHMLNSLSEKARKYANGKRVVYATRPGGSGMGDVMEVIHMFRYKATEDGGFFYQDFAEGYTGAVRNSYEEERKYIALTPENMNRIVQRGKKGGFVSQEWFPDIKSFFSCWDGGVRIPEEIREEVLSTFQELKQT